MSTAAHDATSVSDEQWHVLQLMFPESKWQPGGPRRPPLDLRRVLDGIFYINTTGCQWRMIPRDFGNGMTIYGYFRLRRLPRYWPCFQISKCDGCRAYRLTRGSWRFATYKKWRTDPCRSRVSV